MIKFFRHIRQNLLMEDKTGKPAAMPSAGKPAGRYLKYAIGEIVLVVIGILIALQINAWYETSKKMKLKQVYTKNLLKDLSNDTLQLNDRLRENENIYLKKLDSIVGIIEHPATTVNSIKELGKNVGIGGLRITNNYNTSTFNILISSGNIDLFEDHVIQKIMELNALQNFQLEVTSGNHETFFDLYNRYREKYLLSPDASSETLNNELWDRVDAFEHAPIFINAIKVKEHAITRYISLTEEVVDKTEELIQILEDQ